jgi:hypothetical protein
MLIKKLFYLIAISWCLIFCLIEETQAEPVQSTKIITFKPNIPTGKSVSGYCWTNSIAVNRPEAWRCMVGNSIMDPCFETSVKNQVICNSNPIAQKSGVTLKLTKPLPQSQIRTTEVRPWIIKLADGGICQPYTGTMPITDKGGVSYYCTFKKSLFPKDCYAGLIMDSIKQANVWTAQKIIYCSSKQSQTGLAAKQIQTMNILTVWN